MRNRIGRYSGYLRPISYTIDIGITILFAFFINLKLSDFFALSIYLIIAWLFISLRTGFYEIYRFTKVTKILSLSILQALIFTLAVFAFFGYKNQIDIKPRDIFNYAGFTMLIILIVKLSIHYLLKKYRRNLGGNHRRTIIIGQTFRTHQLYKFFQDNPDYGYHCQKVFQVNEKTEMSEIFEYVLNHDIDELYASISKLSDDNINELIDFADNNLRVLKFIPDNKEVYSKQIKYDYYGVLPIISLRKIPIDESFNRVTKRVFDLILSVFVLVFILSWLTPLLAILIKLESKGPVFFKQKRNGRNYQEFYCYKYRSMRPNLEADIHQVRKNDKRITKIGKFMRKTSIDELPQFYNVLLGDMSVVGPRPHMVSHTNMYAERVDKFMVRHFIKPGITGLAQVSGYRGEVETEHDIINRVKYDIYYLENWSLLIDIKVIFLTVFNALKGDKKAY
ncbi:undecaprenyl-phosphate glucose phosphotransferase [Psychroflexus halocasei]|uniref:Putative colanic acid biosysnthesis UDP-glucose lipid carrier transferase n=1 Tax=Psychroflexus halocasei TaxID=908615 RepID=A0A1H4BN07_9FLAO|nr:undecaprenyl-phosphate glucose phosphotransferase [Psychroflexus halocasei]SEA49428.1 putative colanic acid biosysnthesis UDP-glucose lipid carrier transferase [Psychroflexus halocasei]